MRNAFLVILCLFIVSMSNDLSAQTCKPASIPASTPDSQLNDNGDGTITDTKTGLMWKKCAEGLSGSDCATGTSADFTWQQALEQPGVVNSGGGFAGYTDWRLPNYNELYLLADRTVVSPAINSAFQHTVTAGYWTSTTIDNSTNFAWSVIMDDGRTYRAPKTESYAVMCVAGVTISGEVQKNYPALL